jgi:hypothetical protein
MADTDDVGLNVSRFGAYDSPYSIFGISRYAGKTCIDIRYSLGPDSAPKLGRLTVPSRSTTVPAVIFWAIECSLRTNRD